VIYASVYMYFNIIFMASFKRCLAQISHSRRL
jgi:hypothetical protein